MSEGNSMTFYTLAITKTIVVTVEAEDYVAAQEDVYQDFHAGEYDRSWISAEPHFSVIAED